MSDQPAWVDTILAAIGQTRTELVQTRTELVQTRAELVQTRADIMERIDRLQNTVTAMRDEDVVNFGAAERAEKIALGAREETRIMGEQVNAMARQIKRLQSDVREIRGES